MIFLRDSSCLCAVSYRGTDMIFSILCHAFCMWHWPIGNDLDLGFICGHHHLHLVDDQSISWLLHYSLHRADGTQQGRNSCPLLQFLAFSSGYHVVAPLSIVRSLHLLCVIFCFLVFLFLADRIFYRSFVNSIISHSNQMSGQIPLRSLSWQIYSET